MIGQMCQRTPVCPTVVRYWCDISRQVWAQQRDVIHAQVPLYDYNKWYNSDPSESTAHARGRLREGATHLFMSEEFS